MALLIPVLTSRRTAQGGVLLAMILLFLLLPRGRRTPILLVLALIIPLALTSLALRSGDSKIPFLEKVLIDVSADPNSDPRNSRFYELETAWKTVREEPFFGVGPSGSFKVTSPAGLYYHQGKYDFVHSGFGHVLLKTGFVGLFIFIGIFFTFILYVKRGWKAILPEYKALAVGGMCGFAAQIPNFFFGPPVIEIRTMQVGGLMFAIPMICIALSKRKAKASKADEINDLSKSVDPLQKLQVNQLGKQY
jgi:O-antigen ligase